MSFYRTLLAAVAAVAIAAPVFADDAASTTNATGTTATQTDTSSAQQSASDQTGATSTDSKINLNKATAKELMKVKGLNAAKARAIVAYRKKHGEFKTLDDLNSVKGFKKVKPDTMKNIQDQLSVE